MNPRTSLSLSLLAAAMLWFFMFFPYSGLSLNFWCAMSGSALLLATLSFVLGGRPRWQLSWSELLLGVAIAVVLWGVFWAGDKLSQLLFAFARPQVDSIYGMKDGTPPALISVLLLGLIGPAEELFWRGYVQRTMSEWWSPDTGFVCATAVYTLVHLPSLNFMLIVAAAVCGVLWGGLYRLFPKHFAAIVISHALWDAAAFVWFPF